MSFDLKLLVLFAERETYQKYKAFIPKDSLSTMETLHMLGDYEAFYKAFPSATKIDWADFKLWGMTIRHSQDKSDALDAWLLRVADIEKQATEEVDKQILSHFSRKQAAKKIIELADKISTGDETDFGSIITIVEKYKKEDMVSDDVSKLFGTTDLSAILESRVRSGGLEWRIPSFNRAAGPIHSGDFVMLAARPEAGKTSWLCSELTHMVTFLECIWLRAYERLKSDGREGELLAHAPIVQDQRLRGTSSWANNWLGRDHASKNLTKPPAPASL